METPSSDTEENKKKRKKKEERRTIHFHPKWVDSAFLFVVHSLVSFNNDTFIQDQ